MSQSLAKDFNFRSLLKFAFPSIIMMIFMSLYSIVDGFFIAQYVDSMALSAANIVYPAVSILLAVGIMFGTGATTEFLEKFFRNLILNEQNELKNRNLQIDEIEKEAIQSAKQTDMDIPKCKNCTLDCTLEEIAVLNYLKEKPNATQKEIAQHIGKSERTVKSMTVNLSERGIIERKNGRRNGFWEIKK